MLESHLLLILIRSIGGRSKVSISPSSSMMSSQNLGNSVVKSCPLICESFFGSTMDSHTDLGGNELIKNDLVKINNHIRPKSCADSIILTPQGSICEMRNILLLISNSWIQSQAFHNHDNLTSKKLKTASEFDRSLSETYGNL